MKIIFDLDSILFMEEKDLQILKKENNKVLVFSNKEKDYKNYMSENYHGYKYIDTFYYDYEIENLIKNKQSYNKNISFVLANISKDFEDKIVTNKIPCIKINFNQEFKTDNLFSAGNSSEVVDIISKIKIFNRMKEKIIESKSRIVGVNGVDTSGKTFFTQEFSRFLKFAGVNNEIINIDDFHNPKKIRYDGINEIEAYYNNAFNYKQLLKEILIPLKNDEEINKTITCLELDKDKYCKEIEYIIDRNDIVIIEGVLLFREPILNYIDIKIFLDIGYDEVIKRAEIRDVPKYGGEFLKKYINKYIPIQKKYIKEYKPKIISDFVVDNTNFNRPVLI